ncbi:hypothetical protein ACI797_11680 [Geodermatophilus sp. SYSU D00691]
MHHFPLPELSSRAWREEAMARAAEIQTLSNWISGLPSKAVPEPADSCLAAAISYHVTEALGAAGSRWPPRREGARLARAAGNLHAAEADLLRRAPGTYLRGELPNLDAHVRRHLPIDDPRRLRVEDLARRERDRELATTDGGARTGSPVERSLTPLEKEGLIAAVRVASSAAAREQQRVRSFRTIVLSATVVLFVLALLVGVVGAIWPRAVALCFQPQQEQAIVCPTNQTSLPDPIPPATEPDVDVDEVIAETVRPEDVPLIEGIGMVSAGVTGALSLRRLRGSSTPFGVPVALTVLKLPTGALTAFLGLLLIRGEFIPGLTALDTTPQIIAWAVVFGASQQLFTGLVDRQAQSVLESVGGKTYTATGGS